MKSSILSLCIVHSALCILPAAARTPEQTANDLFALTNRILRLEHGDDMLEALPRWAEREGLSADDLSRTLVLAADALRGATNREDLFSRKCAISALGFCGTTNAVPYLESLVKKETGPDFDIAMNALIILTKADGREIEEIRRIVTQERRGDSASLYGFYREMAHVLKWRTLDPKRASVIREILLDIAAESTDWPEVADEILCAHVSGYAASSQRQSNLERALASIRANGRDGIRLEQSIKSLPVLSPGTPRPIPDPTVEFGPKYPEPDEFFCD